MEEQRGVEEKWRIIGEELGVRVFTYSDSTDCLREVVMRRLQSRALTTWGTIIVALKKAGEPQVVDKLKAKYYPGELTTTT